MTDPEDADYKCTLTEFSLQKAIKELNEDPKQRLGSVQTLRKWVRQQPHFTCRTDTQFMLAILRRAKFSQLVARQLIDNILTARTSHSEYMANLDVQDVSTLAFIETGAVIHLPKTDKDGRKILIMRAVVQDPSDPRFQPNKQVRCNIGLSELYREEGDGENISVNGLMLVFDFTGAGMKHINAATMDQRKIFSKIYQDCNPERVKAFIFYNVGPVLEIMMTIAKTFFKKKNQERIQVHDNMESLYKVIPMELWPDEYLPDDYKGPSAGSIASITADMKKRVMNDKSRTRVLANTSDKYKIDESKRPSEGAPSESFRKLNVD